MYPSCTSKAGKEAFNTHGYAIVDTGASRSVIGSENLPQMLSLLDRDTRDRIKEKPSRIGFRFGNNQIEYSYKQIWVPIRNQSQQIWLIIEVVPKGTPFLLSIQTMRKLGAVLDLTHGTCHLQKLDKAISLKQGTTGLLMISLADLCQNSSVSALAASKIVDQPAPEQICCHAHQEGHHGDDSRDRRCGHAASQDTPDSPDESGADASGRTRRADGSQRTCIANAAFDARSSKPEDHATANRFQSEDDRNKTIISRPPGLRMVRSFRERDPSVGRRTANDERERSSLRSPESSSSDDITSCDKSSISEEIKSGRPCWNEWRPLKTDRSSRTRRTHSGPRRSLDSRAKGVWERIHSTSWQRRGLDSRCNDVMGPQDNHLGKETPRKDVLPDLRDRRSVCELVPEPNQFTRHASPRFRQVLPSPTPDGSTSPTGSVIHLATKVSNRSEVNWLRSLRKELENMDESPGIDLLEVYAQPNSRLAEETIKHGGIARRFTREHGDLSTYHGQLELLRMVCKHRPKRIWVAPECAPWCSWNRFNAGRSLRSFQNVQTMQEQSKEHLKLCTFLCKIQVENGRHFTMENPGSSGMWHQAEVQEIIRLTKTVMLDQCQLGLKHPQNRQPIKKNTRLQTTSRAIVRNMDDRRCSGEHTHHQIAGTCHFQGRTIALSRFAAFYPQMFAKKGAKGIIEEDQNPDCPVVEASNAIELLCPVREAESPPESEPGSKRSWIKGPEEDPLSRKRGLEPYEPSTELTGQSWTEVMEKLQAILPKSGAQTIDLQTWPGRYICEHSQIADVQEIKAIKGVERYMLGDHRHTHRQTICLCRNTKRVMDLGVDEWTKMPQTQQRRKAIPSHIMIAIFGRNPEGLDANQAKSESMIESIRKSMSPSQSSKGEGITSPFQEASQEEMQKAEVDQRSSSAAEPLAPIPSWTPNATINSGPKFLELSSKQQTMIKKMHNNLGHPVSDKIGEHLKRLGFTERMVEGAKDYQCQSCAERVPPKLTTPGKLKEPRDFNERIAMDGFEWKGEKGHKFYVLHFFDEASHFHLGRRCLRTSESLIKTFVETWTHWAGTPLEIQHDEAGEFISQTWKDYLQREGIRAIVSAAPWQRGRIERHGGIIKEMLSRVDQEKPIKNEKQFDEALNQCFQAKNSLTIVKGYSPEQAVLGRSRRLPASICGDEDFTAHSIDDPRDTRSEDFLQKMEVRTLARKALLEADNSQAIRRAINRQSRGQEHHWQCGELCMVWDKRKSPNMLEKERWTGPCQVIMEESRTVLWVTYMNRLLRVARENIRPVSIREFSKVASSHQSCDEKRLEAMANQLRNQLRERSGMFQFSDLTEVENPESTNPETRLQPEEEPLRRESEAEVTPPAIETPQASDPTNEAPVSNEPSMNEPPNESDETPGSHLEGEHQEGGERGVNESTGDSFTMVNEVYNVNIVEVNDANAVMVRDNGTLWPCQENIPEAAADFCMFEFDVPTRHLSAFCIEPCLHVEKIVNAAKRNHVEVVYKHLSPSEKQEFDEAKNKELGCWIETSSIEPLLRDKIHQAASCHQDGY